MLSTFSDRQEKRNAMPHQIIEYSANLEPSLHLAELIELLHETAASVDAFPLAGLRTRAVRRDHYRIADAHPENGFIHVVLRVAHGRPLELRQAAGERIFSALCEHLEPIYASAPLAISFEMQEIDPDLRWKQNNLRDYLTKRQV
jgi:5-carboxymethyl-2-hydroxymuconate isomerase